MDVVEYCQQTLADDLDSYDSWLDSVVLILDCEQARNYIRYILTDGTWVRERLN